MTQNVCMSGGAKGADEEWGIAAFKKGHTVIHYSFEGHKVKHSKWAVVLTEAQLRAADPFLKIANKTMKRSYPTNSSFVNNLLRRNYYQICNTDRLYGVASIDPATQMVTGGTSWAVQMYVDRCLKNNDLPEIYIFDQLDNNWKMWTTDGWEIIERPPIPYGIWTGIGSRELTKDGQNAIRTVFF